MPKDDSSILTHNKAK